MSIKIAVGIPNIGTINSKTAKSLMEMMRLPYEFIPVFQEGAYVSSNREMIVETAKKLEATHLLFIDHDIQFFNVTIDLMLKHDKDIVAAPYNYRFLPANPMVKIFDAEDGAKSASINDMPSELFKVAGIGMGCCLIKMSVFDRIEKPYFPMLYDEMGMVIRSEDIGFCEKARSANFDIWCDPTLTVKHIGQYAY